MSDLRSELLVKWRGELDALPPATVVIPADVVKRKSSHYAAELPDYVPLEVAWNLLRSAIDDALGTPKEPLEFPLVRSSGKPVVPKLAAFTLAEFLNGLEELGEDVFLSPRTREIEILDAGADDADQLRHD